MQALSVGWYMVKYKIGHPVAEHDDGQEDEGSNTTNIDEANKTIRSKLFWGSAKMVDIIAWVLLMLMGWAEDCPCHDDEIEAAGFTRRYYLCSKQ